MTVLSITHDIDEAASADHILMIDDGHFVEEADPEKIFSHGAQLIQMGLDVPFAEKVKRALATRGVDTPQTYMDEGSLADWLWKSRLKK